MSLRCSSSLSHETNGAGATAGKHEPPQKGDPFKGKDLHSGVFLLGLIFISTKWCCDKSPQDRGRMAVIILYACFTWTGESRGVYTALDFEQGSLRKCGAAQGARRRKAVGMALSDPITGTVSPGRPTSWKPSPTPSGSTSFPKEH